MLLALVFVANLANVVHDARTLLVSPDEIINVDAAYALLREGDYTSTLLGGQPFDPAITNGVLTTAVDGILALAGCSLLTIRIAARLLPSLLLVGVGAWILRRRGVETLAAWAVSGAVWLVFDSWFALSVQLTTNRNELWTAMILVVGLRMAECRPVSAAFVWGLAIWMGKIIYLPIAGCLILAVAWVPPEAAAGSGQAQERLRRLARMGAAFLAPLLIWLTVIWVRYDGATVQAWVATWIFFLGKHSVWLDLGVSPSSMLHGWRFEPDWASEVSSAGGKAWGSVIHVVLPALLTLRLLVQHHRHRLAGSLLVRNLLFATCGAAASLFLWFLLGDPTRWDEHLLPVAHATVCVGFYCAADLAGDDVAWRDLRKWVEAVAWVATLAGLVAMASWALGAWKVSYASLCLGAEAHGEMCIQNEADALMGAITEGRCRAAGDHGDRACRRYLAAQRREILARLFAQPSGAVSDRLKPEEIYAAVFVQSLAYWDHDAFAADLCRLKCGPAGWRVEQFLVQARFSLDACDCKAVEVPSPGS